MSNNGDSGAPAGAESPDGLEALDMVSGRAEAAISHLTEGCDASAVFSTPETIGDRTYITASTVQKMGGFGFGGGGGVGGEYGTGTTPGTGGGGGAGGGGNSEGRPVAIIEIGPDGVQIKPVLDFTKIGLTAIAAALTILKLIKRAGR